MEAGFFGGSAFPLFLPVTFYSSFIAFPVNYSKNCLIGYIYNFDMQVCFFFAGLGGGGGSV